MILDLVKKGIISKKNLVVQYYKKAGLNENQLAIVLLVMQLNKNNSGVAVTPSDLSEYMSISADDIEVEMSDLIDQKLIKMEFKASKKIHIIDITPLINKIIIIVENETISAKDESEIEIIEKYFNIELTVPEQSTLEKLIEGGATKLKIIESLANQKVENVKELFAELKKITSANHQIKLTKYNWLAG